MSDQNMQEQIITINQKLDVILENIEQQQRKREEIEDLLKELNIVAKDAVQHSVILLDKAQVDLEARGISSLVIKILQNIDTFFDLLEMMESARDFMKDVSP